MCSQFLSLCPFSDPRTDSERERPGGSSQAGIYLRCHRPKRSHSPRFLPLEPTSSTLNRGGKVSQSVSQAFGQAGIWSTYSHHDVSPSASTRSAPARTARSPQRLRMLCTPDARMKYERVRRGADREALRASPACHRTPQAEDCWCEK